MTMLMQRFCFLVQNVFNPIIGLNSIKSNKFFNVLIRYILLSKSLHLLMCKDIQKTLQDSQKKKKNKTVQSFFLHLTCCDDSSKKHLLGIDFLPKHLHVSFFAHYKPQHEMHGYVSILPNYKEMNANVNSYLSSKQTI